MPRSARPRVKLKRAYEAPAKSDGLRILVDQVWPRGISKYDLRLNGWLKEVAPSTGLRKWFNHDPAKWDAFKNRYFQELDKKSEVVERLRTISLEGIVTLVFGAKDIHYNNATALKEYLERPAGK